MRKKVSELRYNGFKLEIYETENGTVKGYLSYKGSNGVIESTFEKGTCVERVAQFFSLKF